MIFEENTQEIKHWSSIQTAMEQYSLDLKDNRNFQQLFSVQQSPSIISPYLDTRRSTQSESHILDLDKLLKETRFEGKNSTIDRMSITDTHYHSTHMKNYLAKTITTSPSSPEQIKTSQLFNSFQAKPPAKLELRKALVSQFESQNHFINGLVRIFKSTSEGLFAHYISDLCPEKYTKEHEEVYNSAVGILKRFVNITTKFIYWIYEDLILPLEDELDLEDLTPGYVIESALYDLLFKPPHTTLEDLIKHLMSIRYNEETEKLQDVLLRMKPQTLENYDGIFESSRDFLLNDSSRPYSEVIKTIKDLHQISNPYLKFEATKALEDEMWNCIQNHYRERNDNQYLQKLKQSFGMDTRIPIALYCVVQSQSEHLIVARHFIEEFVRPNTLSISLGFTTFKSSIDLLLSDDYHRQVGMSE